MQPETYSAGGYGAGDAGRILAEQLTALSLGETVVVALSPQSVGLAFEAVRRLGCELDLLLIGRIFAPGHPEQPIGSMLDLDTPRLTIDEELARDFHVPPGYLNNERQRQTAELARQHFMYLGDDDGLDTIHSGKDVVVLDEGVEPAILTQVFRHLAEAGAHSVHVLHIAADADEPVDDRTIAHMLKETRRLHRMLH